MRLIEYPIQLCINAVFSLGPGLKTCVAFSGLKMCNVHYNISQAASKRMQFLKLFYKAAVELAEQ